MIIEGRAVDLRVSTCPLNLRKCSFGVLDKSAVNLDLDNLGLPENVKRGIRDAVRRPNGIFWLLDQLVRKTTTPYRPLERLII